MWCLRTLLQNSTTKKIKYIEVTLVFRNVCLLVQWRRQDTVANCKQCAALSTNPREPLIPSTLPQFSHWQIVGADIFQLPQMSAFATSYGLFQHKPSSLQRNGHTECMIQTVKMLLSDPSNHNRSTPLGWCGLSPAELLMGRCLRADLPLVKA